MAKNQLVTVAAVAQDRTHADINDDAASQGRSSRAREAPDPRPHTRLPTPEMTNLPNRVGSGGSDVSRHHSVELEGIEPSTSSMPWNAIRVSGRLEVV